MLVVLIIWQIPHPWLLTSHIGIYMHCGLVKQDTFMPIADSWSNFVPRFMSVLVCLVFSVLSTIEEYKGFANETLFWMVGPFSKINLDWTRPVSHPALIFPLCFGSWSSDKWSICTISSDFCIYENISRKYVWWRFLGSSTLSVFGRQDAGVYILPLNTNLSFLFISSIAKYFSINQSICLI